jgi:hypothetical protein
MPGPAPADLDSKSLAARLRELSGEERNVQVEFLLHLDEYDRRRAYLEAGYGSLWTYCLEALHLREGAAGRRIHAMRVLRRFPVVEGALRDGKLCLSTIAVLGTVLTEENLDDLVSRAAYRTKAEVEQLAASVQSRRAPRDGIRKIATREGLQATAAVVAVDVDATPALTLIAEDGRARNEDAMENTEPELRAASGVVATAMPVQPTLRRSRPEMVPVSGSDWSLRVTIDERLKADLETLRCLLSHKSPGGDLASVLREAVRCGIEKHGKRRGAVAPERERKASGCSSAESSSAGAVDAGAHRPERRSRPPARVKREVFARDEGGCAWIGEGGRRCGSRWQLEFDHVQAAAFGGDATVDGMRLLCRAHNVLHAENVFGREFMARSRRGGHGPGTARARQLSGEHTISGVRDGE